MMIRLVNGGQVRALLPMETCIDLMRAAMAEEGEGATVQPIRSGVRRPKCAGLVGVMHGYAAGFYGVKALSIFPENYRADEPSHQGFVILFETGKGAPIGIVDAREITAIRTAAATAVATDLLAPPNAESLAIFGYGEQAQTHLEALTQVRPFRTIWVWGRSAEKAQSFCERQPESLRARLAVAATAADAAKADVLCTVSAASDPILKGEWLQAGQHINLVGSGVPTTAELDPHGVERGLYFVDYRENALALAGEFLRARQAGLVSDDHIVGSIGDVLSGRITGRSAPDDITIFKSLGMISEDIFAARHVLAEAERVDTGLLLPWR